MNNIHHIRAWIDADNTMNDLLSTRPHRYLGTRKQAYHNNKPWSEDFGASPERSTHPRTSNRRRETNENAQQRAEHATGGRTHNSQNRVTTEPSRTTADSLIRTLFRVYAILFLVFSRIFSQLPLCLGCSHCAATHQEPQSSGPSKHFTHA